MVLVAGGCSSTVGSTAAAKEMAERQDDEKMIAEASDEQIYCRREHTLRGSRFNTRTCRTASQIEDEERAQRRMREGVRRMQDHASQEKIDALGIGNGG